MQYRIQPTAVAQILREKHFATAHNNASCPVAPLDALQVHAQLGLISVGNVEASFVRCLVAFNDVQLEDEESLLARQRIYISNACQDCDGT